MKLKIHLIAAPLIGLMLGGCTQTTQPGVNGGTEQLRASLAFDLRRAGVPDACIRQLSNSTLAEVKGLSSRSARSSREVLIRHQRIRAAASKDCPGL